MFLLRQDCRVHAGMIGSIKPRNEMANLQTADLLIDKEVPRPKARRELHSILVLDSVTK